MDRAVDDVIEALDGLVDALRRNAERIDTAKARASELRAQRDRGLTYRDIVRGDHQPLLVQLATANIAELSDAGARFRRAEARALYDEGMTMDEIAKVFGCTRQRISTLINQPA